MLDPAAPNPENTERVPISSENNMAIPKANIVLVTKPLEVQDLLPKVEFLLSNMTVSSEAKDLQNMLVAFLKENESLVNNGEPLKEHQSVRDFTDGFRNAIAIVNLWIDSLYVTGVQNEPNTP